MGAESYQAARARAMRDAHGALRQTVEAAIRDPGKPHRFTYSLNEVTYVLGLNSTSLFLLANQGQAFGFTPLGPTGDRWILAVSRVARSPYPTKPGLSERDTYTRLVTIARQHSRDPDELEQAMGDIDRLFNLLPRGIQEELRMQGMSPEFINITEYDF